MRAADALYGAWLAGTVLGAVSIGIHHKLCHTLGGTFNLPHAEVHTVILPHAVEFNRRAAPEAMRDHGRSTGCEECGTGPVRSRCADRGARRFEGYRYAG